MDGTHWQLASFVHAGRPHRRRYRAPILSVDTQAAHVVEAIERAALVGGIRLVRIPPPHPRLPFRLEDEESAA
jgi:hypothetical protein